MDQEIKKLVKKNLEVSREIQQMVKYIKKYIIFQQIFGVIKVLLIVVPLVLGVIYLPPLIKDVWQQYQGLLGVEGMTPQLQQDNSDNNIQLNKDKIPPELLEKLQQYK